MIDFRKVILAKYPDADFDRYRFQSGDIFKVGDAILLCKESLIMDVVCYVIKRSLLYRELGTEIKVPYKELPKEPIMVTPTICKRNKWKTGDVVQTEDNMTVYLYKEEHPHYFYGWVIQSENEYYLHTGIALPSPIYYYVN